MPDFSLLAPLHRYYASTPDVEFLSADALPQPARDLLVHDRDMTSRLAQFHGSGIGLEAHSADRQGPYLFRVSVLRRVDTGVPVEFGAIRIDLTGFAGVARQQIEDASLPLGAILVEQQIPFTSHPSGFFRIGATGYLEEYLGAEPGDLLYGRCNQLRHPDGQLIADVVEILPRDV